MSKNKLIIVNCYCLAIKYSIFNYLNFLLIRVICYLNSDMIVLFLLSIINEDI